VGTPDIDLYVAVASLYLAIAAQMGIVGLLAFLLVVCVFFVYLFGAWKKLSRHSWSEPYLLGYGAAVFGSLVSGMLDHTLLTYPHAVALLWMTLGVATVVAQGVRERFSR
jgi:O-antigen ligase